MTLPDRTSRYRRDVPNPSYPKGHQLKVMPGTTRHGQPKRQRADGNQQSWTNGQWPFHCDVPFLAAKT